MAERLDRVRGDATGLIVPAHVDALRADGAEWLTRAFHAFGSLPADNGVAEVVGLTPCPGGSTGAKFLLDVVWRKPDPALHSRLFVKFSRDFDDERRDGQREEMAGEARLLAIGREAGFPIRVPAGYFADYHAATGTGLVITETIAFGQDGIEPHRRKAMDHLTLGDPLEHYRAIVTALARLAGAHRAGQLGPRVTTQFPFDPQAASADPIRYTEAALVAELDRCEAFARDCPQLLPAEVRTPAFLARMRADALLIRRHEPAIRGALLADPRMIALCHWNAHIDNCWFWRDGEGLHCGLIDWGRAGQLTFGSILWGALSAAHHAIWDEHLDDLTALFAAEYQTAGGPAVTAGEIREHLTLHMAAMGVARVLAFPEIIRFRLPECVSATGPFDPMFHAVDPARNCRQVYVNFLQFWRRQDFGAAVRRLVSA